MQQKTNYCLDCAYFRNIRIGPRGSVKGSCTKRTTISWRDWRYGKTPACKRFERRESDKPSCKTCKHYTVGEYDGSCGSYVCKDMSGWEEQA